MKRWSEVVNGALLLLPAMHATERDLPPYATLVEDEALLAELDEEEVRILREQQIAVVLSRVVLGSLRRDVIPARQKADHEFLAKLREEYLFSLYIDVEPE